jgi:hypothetical protein
MVELAGDMRRHNFNFMETASTVATTSDVEYVDMTADVFAVIPGSVRCSSEDIILYPISPSVVNMVDADRDERDVPNWYWIKSSLLSDSGQCLYYPDAGADVPIS